MNPAGSKWVERRENEGRYGVSHASFDYVGDADYLARRPLGGGLRAHDRGAWNAQLFDDIPSGEPRRGRFAARGVSRLVVDWVGRIGGLGVLVCHFQMVTTAAARMAGVGPACRNPRDRPADSRFCGCLVGCGRCCSGIMHRGVRSGKLGVGSGACPGWHPVITLAGYEDGQLSKAMPDQPPREAPNQSSSAPQL